MLTSISGFGQPKHPEPERLNDPGGGAEIKVAVTLLFAVILIVQVVLLPEQAPDQPVNVEPEESLAVRVTDSPFS